MRKLTIFEHISLDGVIELPDGEADFPHGDWTAPYRTPTGLEAVLAAQGERFDLLLGRRTYDLWSGYWPGAPASPMADRLNAATKYVATHRPETLEWGPVQGVGPGLVEDVRRLKSQEGPDLILWGSSTLTAPLFENRLVDRVVLIVYPVLLGSGKRLSAGAAPGCALEPAGSRTMQTGVTLTTYEVVGSVQSGEVTPWS